LGIFALPELCDLLISRRSISAVDTSGNNWRGLWQGTKDCFVHWWLVVRCSWIGSVIGGIPGIGTAVIDWVSYAHAMKTERGARETFGKGDVRGVIAAESATCSREGGALVPTIVFGVPGSPGMALLLGAFLMHGLVPGPDMLTTGLGVTYSMVWSIAVANILGSGLCFLFSTQIAKVAGLRYTLILPVVLSLIYIGAFEGQRSWGDFYTLLAFGIFGWVMKHLKWPRPPLVLGFILGKMLERYMFISIQRYGANWLLQASVLILFALAAMSLTAPLLRNVRQQGWGAIFRNYHRPVFQLAHFFPLFLIGMILALLAQMTEWSSVARIVPKVVCFGGVLFCLASLVNSALGDDRSCEETQGNSSNGPSKVQHLDIGSTLDGMPTKTIVLRGLTFFGWLVGFMISMALIGLIPTVPIFIVALMRLEGRERWGITLPMAIVMTIFIAFVFNYILALPWPDSYLGDVCGWCKTYIPST
jgi:hypothetical protein